MGEYAVRLPLGNFNLNNKETRRLELWKNQRGMWFDHAEHMEEGQEQNKEWKNFWWTVDEDMFTYVMMSKIEELIDEKLNQEFPEEVEIRENQDFDLPLPSTLHPLQIPSSQGLPPSFHPTAQDLKSWPLNDNSTKPSDNGRNTRISPMLAKTSFRTASTTCT